MDNVVLFSFTLRYSKSQSLNNNNENSNQTKPLTKPNPTKKVPQTIKKEEKEKIHKGDTKDSRE